MINRNKSYIVPNELYRACQAKDFDSDKYRGFTPLFFSVHSSYVFEPSRDIFQVSATSFVKLNNKT